MANLNFDANQVEPRKSFEPIPAGKYEAMIVASAMKPTRSGRGNYLELTFQVLAGPYANRKMWSRLNLDNPSTPAVQIARAELSAICRAIGVMTPKDSVELHNLPLVIKVHQVTGPNGEPANEIRGYEKRELVAPAAPASAPSNPPWRK